VWQILGTRQFWGIALPRFLAEPAWGTFNAWIPLFMFKVYGFNLKEIAMFAWMPMLFADLGCIVGLPATAVPALVWCEPDCPS
jgi:ACS family hexuronate transporter-like MFS transporter